MSSSNLATNTKSGSVLMAITTEAMAILTVEKARPTTLLLSLMTL